MKLSELCGKHVGKHVTITTGDGAISGTLFAVEHVADRIADTKLTSRETTYVHGRYRVSVSVGAADANSLDPLFDCEVGA